MTLRKATVGLVLVVSGALYATPLATPFDSRSGNELLEKADLVRRRMAEHLDHAQHLQAKARIEKDYLKLGCVNRGVTTAQQLITMSTDATASLEHAIQIGDRAAQTAQFNKISFASNEADRSSQDVDSCVGVHQLRVAVTEVEIKRREPAGDRPGDKQKPNTGYKHHDSDVFQRTNNLGAANYGLRSLEYLAFASPFTPN